MFGYSMLSPKFISSLVVICLLSYLDVLPHLHCGFTSKSPDELISLYLGHAKKNLQSGDQLSFASDIEQALYQPNAILSVNAYFSEINSAKGV
jgi:hypothetical protein